MRTPCAMVGDSRAGGGRIGSTYVPVRRDPYLLRRGRPLPHPIPYQGSKRLLAGRILGVLGPRRFGTVHEPFAGSAAITLAAAARGLARRFVLGDSLAPLVALWERIVAEPDATAGRYRSVWEAQAVEGPVAHYTRIRAEFNADHDPVKLLYLLARCVKNAPRFGRAGALQPVRRPSPSRDAPGADGGADRGGRAPCSPAGS